MNTDILQQYQQYVYGRHNNTNTRSVYLTNITKMLEKINKPYNDITQNDIDRYTQIYLETKKKNGNAIRFWAIRKFIRWTGRTDLNIAQVQPADAGKLALNEKETQKILDIIEKMRPQHRLIFYLEYDTIRRPEEIRKLKIADRYQDILSYDGKTGRKKSFMTERLIRSWDEYIERQRPLPINEEEDRYLLLSDYGQYRGQHLRSKKTISDTIKQICMYAQVEIPQGETPNSYLIKRTTITQHLKDSNDPKIIQLQAGHTNLQTTMKYNRIDDEHMRNYINSWEHKNNHINDKRNIREYKNILETTDTPVDCIDKNIGVIAKKEKAEDSNLSYTFSYTTDLSFDKANHIDDEYERSDFGCLHFLSPPYSSSLPPYNVYDGDIRSSVCSAAGFSSLPLIPAEFFYDDRTHKNNCGTPDLFFLDVVGKRDVWCPTTIFFNSVATVGTKSINNLDDQYVLVTNGTTITTKNRSCSATGETNEKNIHPCMSETLNIKTFAECVSALNYTSMYVMLLYVVSCCCCCCCICSVLLIYKLSDIPYSMLCYFDSIYGEGVNVPW